MGAAAIVALRRRMKRGISNLHLPSHPSFKSKAKAEADSPEQGTASYRTKRLGSISFVGAHRDSMGELVDLVPIRKLHRDWSRREQWRGFALFALSVRWHYPPSKIHMPRRPTKPHAPSHGG